MTFSPSRPFPFPKPRRTGPKFQKPQDPDEPRINEQIRIPEVRLIDENGGQVGIVKTVDALRMARDKGLDLMEVAPTARPPVCKICDFGKYKYEQKKKEQVAKKKQVVIKLKEVQLRHNTEAHDLEHKLNSAREFLTDHDKVKFTVMFKGRAVTQSESGLAMLKDIATKLADVGTVESEPSMEGRKMIMVMAPGVKKK